MTSTIKTKVGEEVKLAMKSRDKARLAALRLIMAEFKRIEVDERVELDDERCLAILGKMTKQRKDSLQQYQDAGRTDLADQESLELDIIAEFLPAQLPEAEIAKLVQSAIAESGAAGMQDMGKVMSVLRPQVQGRADMAAVSSLVKQQLSS